MSTILETATAAVATLAGHGPQQRYRQSVFDNVCDPGILFDSRRIEAEWRKDRSVYEARVKACETLNVDLPKLETAAVEAAAVSAEAEAFARAPLADDATIADLRQRIHAANPNLPVGTPGEMAAGLLFLVSTMPDGFIGRCKSKALAARGAVESARTAAQQTLCQSTADQRPDSTSQSLQQRCEELRRRISARQPTLQAEQLIKQQRAECEKLSRGEYPASYSSLLGQQQPPLANLYRAARRKLDALLDLVAGKPDAEAANQRDQAELARLSEKLAAAHKANLLRIADPQAMRWCE